MPLLYSPPTLLAEAGKFGQQHLPTTLLRQAGASCHSTYFVAFLKLKSMGSCSTPLLPGSDGTVEAIVAFSHSWPKTGTHPQTRHSPTALQKHMQVPHSQDIFSLLF